MVMIKKTVFVLFMILTLFSSHTYALEPMMDSELSQVTAQDGVTVILHDFKLTQEIGHLAIGGEDGLGIPEAPDGAWFVFDSTQVMELDVNRGSFDVDVFTQGADRFVDGQLAIPSGTTAACINFGEALFNVHMSDAILTLKFANNPQGNNVDGMTVFSDTVCNFALNGATVNIKSDDAKMYIFAH